MEKIISLFARNYHSDRLVRDEIVKGAEWVANGEGIATRKFDGTSCLIEDGKLYKRYDAKKGRQPPVNFRPAQKDPDPISGHWPGWLPVSIENPDDRWHVEAWRNANVGAGTLDDGTYELRGPKIQGNPERFNFHVLIKHGVDVVLNCPRTFDALREFLAENDIEGIVWHHNNGAMVKIKGKDFGLRRIV